MVFFDTVKLKLCVAFYRKKDEKLVLSSIGA